MGVEDDVRAVWGVEPLRGLWAQAREALEAAKPPATFRLELPDAETQRAVGELYGRPMWGQGTRISVSKLDEAVRRSRFALGLAEVLEILYERPLARRQTAERDERRERTAETLRAALAEQGLATAAWAEPWTQWLQQYGRVGDDELPDVARRAAKALNTLALAEPPEAWTSRGELAASVGGAHQLDNGTALSRVVLKAAALAHGAETPGNERERRALWERCGVTLDAVSATVLCWALPLVGSDDWSHGVRQRTALGLPTHLTHLDLRAAPSALVEAGTTIAVCENPRVLESAVEERIAHPVVCVSGHPTTVAVTLLQRLTDCGATLHYHSDFDWPGIGITRSLLTHHNARPWRMSAADYREALDRAAATRTDLPNLVGTPLETPWDPQLAELMATTARAIEEEAVLPTLLTDLRTGLDILNPTGQDP
ncbi:TIGR02679 family protein [Saccharopolyspora sp. ASAGF58]|uniref:TIGR02679 family protein n=1 Tax=Saccharopolyspora sp. ASAGF58 TaxID=2719023 RepID=UPI00143FF2C3|nr:TIGR02679 family protein [Saccharopolyspora sp. ASAGF58]QIZ36566.1 TIGR02679 family protein [Saccharopolyspora sp. ASAGF58]